VWEEQAGRYGGPALRVSSASRDAPVRFFLFESPQPLPSPDRYRAEAWVRAGTGDCSLTLVLFDGSTGRESGRHTIVAQRESPRWRYGACDLPVLTYVEGLQCNLEVLVAGEGVVIDAVGVFAADSILANGHFRRVEEVAQGNVKRRIPQAWRRTYRAGVEEAEGSYRVEEDSGGRVLVVAKGDGEFALSSEVVAVPESTAGLVARARLTDGPETLPVLLVRQTGGRGVVAEERSTRTRRDPQASWAVVSTDLVALHPEARRIVLLLRFPRQPGRWRVASADLSSLDAARHDVQVFVDQVGYDSRDPVRFIAATRVFPEDGEGTFSLAANRGEPYTGRLVPVGRSVGESDRDWGSYYFEAIVPRVRAGGYELTVTLGNRVAPVRPIVVGPALHLRETGELAFRFYYVQRCGGDVPGWHGPCHMDDATLPDGTHVDVTGGYHNAGDYNKHMGNNTPVSVYGMISAYENHKDLFDAIDRDEDGRADLLAEAIWGADWLRKMVDPETGHMWTYVGNAIDFFGTPEMETDGIAGTDDDRWVQVDHPGPLEPFTVAAWAALARHTGDDKYRASAEKLWAVNEKRILSGNNPAHVFAAIELHRTTKDEKYRSAADRLVEYLLKEKGGGTVPLAFYALHYPDARRIDPIRDRIKSTFAGTLRVADNPFRIVRNDGDGGLSYFRSNCGYNTQYSAESWGAYLSARLFESDPDFAAQLSTTTLTPWPLAGAYVLQTYPNPVQTPDRTLPVRSSCCCVPLLRYSQLRGGRFGASS